MGMERNIISETPRIQWKPIGDAQEISANKQIVLWHKKDLRLVVGFVDLSDDDDRGNLMDEDGVVRLKWEDYTHWCYVCRPYF
jgi:hypothetical protein